MRIKRGLVVAVFGAVSAFSMFVRGQAAGPVSIQVNAALTNPRVSPTLYGLMTEEINYSYDGGLYAELIRNRVFKDQPGPGEDPNTPPHWSMVQDGGGRGSIAADTANPLNSVLPVSLKLSIASASPTQRVGVANEGYWGIPVKPKTTYRASICARASEGFAGPLTLDIESADGQTIFAHTEIAAITPKWQRFTVTLTTNDTVTPSATNRFVISSASPGTVWLNLVSLFPPTYNDRPNGNRVDLMQLLVDMKPKFLRFPGGNYLEGNDINNFFDFKKTIGDLPLRPTHLSPWNYRSSDGMGLLEFLEWTEDMHAQPVLAVFAGYTLNHRNIAVGTALQPYVQEALDEIEYVTGDKSTKWGAERVADGHPEPIALKYVEIGNEDFFDATTKTHVGNYDGRYVQFYNAIKAKYPALQLIATTPVRGHAMDMIDEHSYFSSAEAAERDAHRFDRRDRNGPKVFMGEWATRIGSPTTNLQGALGDAAFMTGLERNSDFVEISCYAPLFVNVNPGGMQWKSNLIGYDALNSYASPSYYVQKMFSDYLGDVIAPTNILNVPTAPQAAGGRGGGNNGVGRPATLEQLFTCATRDRKTGMIYLKVVNTADVPCAVQINTRGVGSIDPDGTAVVLTSGLTSDTNSLNEPTNIVPVTSKETGMSASFSRTFAPHSVTILAMQSK